MGLLDFWKRQPPPAAPEPPPPPRVVDSTEKALAMTTRALDGEMVRQGPPRPELSASRAAVDGFENFVTGLGMTNLHDKRSANCWTPVFQLSRQNLDAMYRSDWIAKRIVNAPAEDATREWCSLSWENSDKDKKAPKLARDIRNAERAFGLRSKVRSGLKWGRLYGGAGIVMAIKGQNDWSKPLDLDSIKAGDLEMLHVLDRWRIAATGDIDTERGPNFGKPIYYTMAEAADVVAQIHWTRVVIFNGSELPYFEWQRNGRWHDSELQHLVDNVTDYAATRASIASLVHESNVDILPIPNLANSVSTPDGTAKVMKRVALGAQLKGMNRVWIIDAGNPMQANSGEKYEQKVVQFSGVNGVIEEFMHDVCGAAEIPMTRLFGRSPGGLNATGDSDMANYHDKISNYQEHDITPQGLRLYDVLTRHVTGGPLDNFEMEWNPLKQLSAAELATTSYTKAQRDKIYVDMGAIHAGTVARQLMKDDTYSEQTDEDVELAEEVATEPPDPPAPAPGTKAAKGAPMPGAPGAAA